MSLGSLADAPLDATGNSSRSAGESVRHAVATKRVQLAHTPGFGAKAPPQPQVTPSCFAQHLTAVTDACYGSKSGPIAQTSGVRGSGRGKTLEVVFAADVALGHFLDADSRNGGKDALPAIFLTAPAWQRLCCQRTRQRMPKKKLSRFFAASPPSRDDVMRCPFIIRTHFA